MRYKKYQPTHLTVHRLFFCSIYNNNRPSVSEYAATNGRKRLYPDSGNHSVGKEKLAYTGGVIINQCGMFTYALPRPLKKSLFKTPNAKKTNKRFAVGYFFALRNGCLAENKVQINVRAKKTGNGR